MTRYMWKQWSEDLSKAVYIIHVTSMQLRSNVFGSLLDDDSQIKTYYTPLVEGGILLILVSAIELSLCILSVVCANGTRSFHMSEFLLKCNCIRMHAIQYPANDSIGSNKNIYLFSDQLPIDKVVVYHTLTKHNSNSLTLFYNMCSFQPLCIWQHISMHCILFPWPLFDRIILIISTLNKWVSNSKQAILMTNAKIILYGVSKLRLMYPLLKVLVVSVWGGRAWSLVTFDKAP